MLPIAFDADNGNMYLWRNGVAIIIGGLTTSTILNLLILPAFMLAFFSLNKKIDNI